jgi:mannosyltransferase OCH1-like enzyme
MPGPLRLVQYWDTGAPPPQVAALMRTWADDPAFLNDVFDRDGAMAYLAARFPDRVVAAFRKCRYPAMQADLFRYCALLDGGGVYVDADTSYGGGMVAMLDGCARGCIMNRQSKIANDFLYFAAPGDPLLAAVVERAVSNVEGEVSNNVWQVTGPGIMTALYAAPATKSMFEGLRLLPVEVVRKVVLFRWDLDYKKTEEDWREALVPGGKSIFN